MTAIFSFLEYNDPPSKDNETSTTFSSNSNPSQNSNNTQVEPTFTLAQFPTEEVPKPTQVILNPQYNIQNVPQNMFQVQNNPTHVDNNRSAATMTQIQDHSPPVS